MKGCAAGTPDGLKKAILGAHSIRRFYGVGASVPTLDNPGQYGQTAGYDKAVTSAAQPDAFQLGNPGAEPDEYALDSRRYRLQGGFR